MDLALVRMSHVNGDCSRTSYSRIQLNTRIVHPREIMVVPQNYPMLYDYALKSFFHHVILQFNESSYSDNSSGWKKQDTVYTSKPLCATCDTVQLQLNICS